MHVSVTEAKAKLTDLVRRAEAGEEIVLTRHGAPAVRLQALRAKATKDDKNREKELEEILEDARRTMLPGPPAARAADFLYDELGLPR